MLEALRDRCLLSGYGRDVGKLKRRQVVLVRDVQRRAILPNRAIQNPAELVHLFVQTSGLLEIEPIRAECIRALNESFVRISVYVT